MSKKNNKTKGETLVETLMALIVTSLAFLMLPGAIISSSRVNSEVSKLSIYGGDDVATSGLGHGVGELNISIGGSESIKVNVVRYGDKAENGMYEFSR